MDGGSLRGPRSVDTRGANRQEQLARRQPEPAQASAPEPKAGGHYAEHTTAKHANKEKRSFKRFVGPLLAVLVVAALLIGGWMVWNSSKGIAAGVDGSKYQAVFFTNGQVYFGKLQAFNDESMKLTDIFYLQGDESANGTEDSKNPQEPSKDGTNVQLIKLGEEIHGPEDSMILLKDQVLFYENLKTDGKVAQSIDKYKKAN